MAATIAFDPQTALCKNTPRKEPLLTRRVSQLRRESFEARPSISAERAVLMTRFYQDNLGKLPTPILRAGAYQHLCEHKSIHIGELELIVGERGPAPAMVPTFPELNCHTIEDLRILRDRETTPYHVSDETIETYKSTVIPYWRGRSMRERIFPLLPDEWHSAFEAGMFTEFMEQRAPGHTSLDGKIYRKGLREIQSDIGQAIARLDWAGDPNAVSRRDQLVAMSMACDGTIRFAQRHAEMAHELAPGVDDPARSAELREIERVCRKVPGEAPQTFHEALQMYWFVHLGTITELNGWDAMNPGRLDQHLYPFYRNDIDSGVLTPEQAKELLECFWIKFNNHPAPPKVGVTAEESGTYNDFTNINIGGLTRDGSDGVNELSYVMLEVINEIHLLQPGTNIQLSKKSPDKFLHEASRVIRQGYGYPAVFNADAVVEELVRTGKSLEDARDSGVSGCVETGCFGKEAYVLTGYLNTPKLLELALNNGRDPVSGRQIGPETGDPTTFGSPEALITAFREQMHHIVEIKVRGNAVFEQMFAANAPAPFLSSVIDDCIENGMDYNAGGARYNTSFIQCVGIGSVTDALSAIKTQVFENRSMTMADLAGNLAADFHGNEAARLTLAESPRYGNDDDRADDIMLQVFDALHDEIDGRPNGRGGVYHIDMLPTTCHIYFGSVMGASADGRHAGQPLSEGISPVQGADRNGPTAALNSAAKMDHLRTCGTLLNQKFTPAVLAGEDGLRTLSHLVRGYFSHDAHHVQFNVTDTRTLIDAQKHPDQYRGLLVRVAGYSDYFCDIGKELQDEIIARTAQEAV
jgi:trans-4-hydroxy-L-proline dehydratase